MIFVVTEYIYEKKQQKVIINLNKKCPTINGKIIPAFYIIELNKLIDAFNTDSKYFIQKEIN